MITAWRMALRQHRRRQSSSRSSKTWSSLPPALSRPLGPRTLGIARACSRSLVLAHVAIAGLVPARSPTKLLDARPARQSIPAVGVMDIGAGRFPLQATRKPSPRNRCSRPTTPVRGRPSPNRRAPPTLPPSASPPGRWRVRGLAGRTVRLRVPRAALRMSWFPRAEMSELANTFGCRLVIDGTRA